MSLYLDVGSPDAKLTSEQLRGLVFEALGEIGERRKVLAVPPDYSRLHSRAGELTQYIYDYYGDCLRCVLPALGTHAPMEEDQVSRMFGRVPISLFRRHDWRRDVTRLGEVPSMFVHEQSEGKLDYCWPVEVNRLINNGDFDLILSIGQVVPHEVVGMANHSKNILVGTGGPNGINRSHYLGAVYGMERIMGRVDTPVRRVLNYAADRFLAHLPIIYVLTVVARDLNGQLVTRGIYIGDDTECFREASALSLRVNFEMLEKPLSKVVVYLNPEEYKSTWLGNKAIYRTRMALADGGELIVLAPGIKEFGEDAVIDRLIRKHGYRGTEATLQAVERSPELAQDLSAAAHLIHGSSEGRFSITYAAGSLRSEEIESVGFRSGDLRQLASIYNPDKLRDGHNVVAGEDVFFISNPGLGLWAHRSRLEGEEFSSHERISHIGPPPTSKA
jgi:nickel-dependent lactate racemase